MTGTSSISTRLQLEASSSPIEEFTDAANDAGLDKDIMEDCLEELRVLWQEREEEEAA